MPHHRNRPPAGFATFSDWVRHIATGNPPPGECIAFVGALRHGYGAVSFNGRMWLAHRLSWTFVNGEIPPDKQINHRCKQRPDCLNPHHLYLGDQFENMADARRDGTLAVGDRVGARLHPGRYPRGDAHPFRVNPNLVARGTRHRCSTHPELNQKGMKNGQAKLTDDDVIEIRRLYAAGGVSQQRLADMFGVNRSLTGKIIRREIWRHL